MNRLKKFKNKFLKACKDMPNVVKLSKKPNPTKTSSKKSKKEKFWKTLSSFFSSKNSYEELGMPSAPNSPGPVDGPKHQIAPHYLPTSIPTEEPEVASCAPTLTTNEGVVPFTIATITLTPIQEPEVANCASTLVTDKHIVPCATDTTILPKKPRKKNLLNRVFSAFAKFASGSPGSATATTNEATQDATRLPGSAESHDSEAALEVSIVHIMSDALVKGDNKVIDSVIVCAESDAHMTSEADTEPTAINEHQAPTNTDASSAEDTIDQNTNFDPTWGPTKSISAEAIEELAMEHAPTDTLCVKYLGSTAGQNNSVFVVVYHPGMERRCIRVPASGWDGKWSQEDRDQLTRSNNVMRYLRNNTAIPVPEIYHWDTELDNVIGAPFTIMAFIDGQSPQELWFEGVYPEQKFMEEDDDMDEFYSFDFTRVKRVKGLETRRQKILKSLAATLAKFQHLKFDKWGSISCLDGGDGPLQVVPFSNLCYGRVEVNYSADSGMDGKIFNHTIASLQYLLKLMKTQWEYEEEFALETDTESLADPGNDPFLNTDINRGLERLYRIVLCCLPIPTRGESETFVLAPPDFGSQNIKCNEDGEITALIDWDLVDTQPHLTGWCLPPNWLAMDWYRPGRYTWPDHVMNPEEIERYRKDYAGYLEDACDDSEEAKDWKYTVKAPMFEAIIDSLIYQDEDRMLETMISLLQTFLPRMDLKMLLRRIGRAQRENRGMGNDMIMFFYEKFQILFDTEEDDYDSDDSIDDAEVATATSTASEKSPSSRASTQPTQSSDGEDEDAMTTIWDGDAVAKKPFSDVLVGDWQGKFRGQNADGIPGGHSAHYLYSSSLPKRRKSWSN